DPTPSIDDGLVFTGLVVPRQHHGVTSKLEVGRIPVLARRRRICCKLKRPAAVDDDADVGSVPVRGRLRVINRGQAHHEGPGVTAIARKGWASENRYAVAVKPDIVETAESAESQSLLGDPGRAIGRRVNDAAGVDTGQTPWVASNPVREAGACVLV